MGYLKNWNGSQFTSQTFSNYCKVNPIKHCFTPTLSPWGNITVSAGHKQAMRKMDPATGLKERLTNFLLVYSSIPRATAGMRPDELFLRRVQTRFSLLSPRVEKHQQELKMARGIYKHIGKGKGAST